MTTTAGKALTDRITAELAARGLECDGKERELLRIAAKLADQLDGLERDIRTNGVTTKISSGRLVVNPSVAAARQAALALAKILGGIEMSEAPAVNRKKQHAAQVRWAAHNQAKAEGA
jgi:hypothetical protein